MPLVAPSSNSKGMESGIYDAICCCVLDVGTQDTKYGSKHQIIIGWSLLSETYSDGTPKQYHETYTFSMNEKAKLREVLSGWVLNGSDHPELLDFESLLGKGCKLVMAPNANGNVRIKSILPHEIDGDFAETEFFSFADWKGGTLPEFLMTDKNEWKLRKIQESVEFGNKDDGAPF